MPVTVTDAPALPGWVGPHSLVVVTSYSGAHRRGARLVAARPAERGATRVAVTAGGAAGRRRRRDGRALHPRAGGLRAARRARPAVRVAGGAAGRRPAWRRARRPTWTPAARGGRPGAGRERRGRRGRRARRRGGGRAASAAAIVLYGAGALGAVAVRLKNQLNENAKAAAFAGGLPEVAHNEVLGWTGAMRAGVPLAAVLLRDPDETVAAARRGRRGGRRAAHRGPPGAGVDGRGRDARSSAPSGCWRSATTSPAGWASASASSWGRSTASAGSRSGSRRRLRPRTAPP